MPPKRVARFTSIVVESCGFLWLDQGVVTHVPGIYLLGNAVGDSLKIGSSLELIRAQESMNEARRPATVSCQRHSFLQTQMLKGESRKYNLQMKT